MRENDQLNRVYGALMGVAVGDAMGMPSELWPRRKILKHFGKIDTFLPSPVDSVIARELKAGEVTDDTLVTLLVAESIIEQEGRIVPEKIIEKIITWAEKDKVKNSNIIGPSTRKAFELISRGTPVEEAGKSGVTNGGAMRIIPVGIVSNWRDLDALVENVRLACLATHNTNIAIAGASAVAAAASYCVDGGDELDAVIRIAKQACEKGMNAGYETAGASISKRVDMGMEIVNSGKREDEILQDLYDGIGTGMATNESVPAALSLVYMAKGDPVKCAHLAANIGGDTDTIGAMSCGICGAFKGIEAFADETIRLITETNHIDFSSVAQRLLPYRLSDGPKGLVH